MAEKIQTFPVPPSTLLFDLTAGIRWDMAIEIEAGLRPAGTTRFLRSISVVLGVSPSGFGMTFSATATGDAQNQDLAEGWEANERAVTFTQGDHTLTIPGPNWPDNPIRDTTDDYGWQVSTAIDDEVFAFFTTHLDTSAEFTVTLRVTVPDPEDLARADLFSLTGREPIYGLEIAHAAVPDNILIVADTRDVTVGARTFTALPFTVILPQDKDDESRQAAIEVDNVGRRMVEWVEASSGGRGATMKVYEFHVVDEDTNAAEVVWEMPPLDVGAARLTNDRLRINLVDRSDMESAAVKIRHDPVESPGLF